MTLKLAEISQESEKPKYDARFNLTGRTYEEPQKDADNFVAGTLVALNYEEPTGELQEREDGTQFVNSQPQIKFTFEVLMESGEYGELKMWTNTIADGVKDKRGDYSRLTKFLICIGAIQNPKTLNARSKITFDLNQLAGATFKFKTELVGRYNKLIADTITLIATADESDG